MTEFPKDKVAVVEKQIERLRKEVDDRIGSNHTLWRAGLAGLGAFILLKESLDLPRVILVSPIICMAFASHWLNQMLTLYRSGDSIAACEIKINQIAGETLLSHETILTNSRRSMLGKRRVVFVIVGVLSTGIYWYAIWVARSLYSDEREWLLWLIGSAVAALTYIAAAANLWRFLSFSWPSTCGVGSSDDGPTADDLA